VVVLRVPICNRYAIAYEEIGSRRVWSALLQCWRALAGDCAERGITAEER